MNARQVLTFFILTACALTARAQSIELSIETGLADFVLETACSGKPVDEEMLRASKVLQTQIKHHFGLSERYTMDAYIEGLQAASRCEVLENDIFRFRYVVNQKPEVEGAMAFLKSHEQEIVDFVLAKTAPYFPADRSFEGEIVLSAAGQSCGGFSMDGMFFIDVPCVAGSIEQEYGAIKVLAAHETYHALQYAFFAPFSEDISQVTTPAQAWNYLFLNLLLEGTAEFVADSREITGEGMLAGYLEKFAKSGYRGVNANLRMLGYAAEILGRGNDSNRRMKDIYSYGFSGENGQPFYYVGAVMAEEIEAALGTEALVCIIALTPEQFVLAYHEVASNAVNDAAPIGEGAVFAARELAIGKPSHQQCISPE